MHQCGREKNINCNWGNDQLSSLHRIDQMNGHRSFKDVEINVLGWLGNSPDLKSCLQELDCPAPIGYCYSIFGMETLQFKKTANCLSNRMNGVLQSQGGH